MIVSKQVLEACGTGGHNVTAPAPTQSLPQSRLPVAMLSRARRRDQDPALSSAHRIRHRHRRYRPLHRHHQLVGLHQRVEMFVRYLVASRSLYTQLPETFCSSETLSAGDYDTCWNGTALAPWVLIISSVHFISVRGWGEVGCSCIRSLLT